MHIPIQIIWKILSSYRFRLTGRRLFNLLHIVLAMGLSRIFRKPVVRGKPALLMVEPTNLCNLQCPMCPSGNGDLSRPRGKMNLDSYRRVLDRIGDTLLLIQFWNQGEPFLHPDLVEMIRYAKQKGIAVMTSTNGHFLDSESRVDDLIRSGLDEIIISLDGVDQESYETYRVGGRFQKVVDGVRLLAERKKKMGSRTPLINLQFLVFKQNASRLGEVRKLARELGADILQLKSPQVYSTDQAAAFLPEDESFRRYRIEGEALRIKSTVPNWCKFLWYGAVLNWDGSLAPCCFDKDGRFGYGNAFEDGKDILSLWTNSVSHEFRSGVLRNRKEIEICLNCFEGMEQDFTQYIPMIQEKRPG
ncbi:MAG TPA: radical SAM/SPASM domain-containing protein [bacterium]|nr:radical SAM/SPASM domain-containing protein [bacterium]